MSVRERKLVTKDQPARSNEVEDKSVSHCHQHYRQPVIVAVEGVSLGLHSSVFSGRGSSTVLDFSRQSDDLWQPTVESDRNQCSKSNSVSEPLEVFYFSTKANCIYSISGLAQYWYFHYFQLISTMPDWPTLCSAGFMMT